MPTILVPIDFSSGTPAALATAGRLARALGAAIQLVHVLVKETGPHGHLRDPRNPPGCLPAAAAWQTVHLPPPSRRPALQDDAGQAPDAAPRTVLVRAEDDAPALRAQGELQRWEDQLRKEGLTVHAVLLTGDPASRILQEADRLEPELILVGSHGHGALHHLLLGSVSESVLRRARQPVLIVPHRAAP